MLFNRIKRSIRKRGMGGTLVFAAQAVLSAKHWRKRQPIPDGFDERFGTDTAGMEQVADLDVPVELGLSSLAYEATKEVDFESALALLPSDLSRFTFVDLGCGKGRVLLMASLRPFAEIIGVEFSPKLAALAEKNITAYRPHSICTAIRVICTDVRQFTFPEVPLVVYMYNPFEGELLNSVIGRLEQSLESSPRQCYLIANSMPSLQTNLFTHVGRVLACAVYSFKSQSN